MNEASRWRIEIARRLAASYAEHPKVLMVAIGGSAARGEADQWSDIDLSVTWDGEPDSAWLEQPPLAAEGTRFTWLQLAQAGPGIWLEQYFIGDLKADVAHLPYSWMEAELASVHQDLDLDSDKQETLEGMTDGIVLHGEEFGTAWKARLAEYPDALREAMVRHHLQFMPPWALSRQGLDRGDLLRYHEVLLPVLRNVLGVLGGLNRKYVVVNKVKRFDLWLERLPLKPPGAAENMRLLLRGEQFETAYPALIEGLLALVEQELPEVDTAGARGLFGFPMNPAGPA